MGRGCEIWDVKFQHGHDHAQPAEPTSQQLFLATDQSSQNPGPRPAVVATTLTGVGVGAGGCEEHQLNRRISEGEQSDARSSQVIPIASDEQAQGDVSSLRSEDELGERWSPAATDSRRGQKRRHPHAFEIVSEAPRVQGSGTRLEIFSECSRRTEYLVLEVTQRTEDRWGEHVQVTHSGASRCVLEKCDRPFIFQVCSGNREPEMWAEVIAIGSLPRRREIRCPIPPKASRVNFSVRLVGARFSIKDG